MEKDLRTQRKGSQEKMTKTMNHLAELQLFANKKAQNIHNIQQKIQNDIKKNEALLDLHCDELSRDIGVKEILKRKPSFDSQLSRDGDSIQLRNGLMSSSNSFETYTAPKSSNSLLSEQPRSRAISSLPRFNINLAAQQAKRSSTDPQKKNKLLA